MIKKILIGLALVIVLFLLVVALRPADYQVTRSATISAPPGVVFEQVNDFQKWDAWSPWAKLDPGVKNTFEGPSAGTGAIFKWAGNKDVGEGRMTLTESHTNDLVKINLEFIKPFASVALTEFTFKPAGNDTSVTWTMSGHNNFIGKAMCLFMNMDKMVGGDFEKGLAQMKSVAEKAGHK